jgi:hypothetical protein
MCASENPCVRTFNLFKSFSFLTIILRTKDQLMNRFVPSLKSSSPTKAWSPSALLHDTRGLSTVEYIILLVVIVVGCVSIWSEIGEDLVSKLAASRDGITGIETPTED